jgi:predicted nucleic acid-binding protein
VISSESQGQPGILNLSTITELSAYDATYLHLALSSGSDLVTSDKDLLALKESHGNIYTPEEYCQL